MNNKNWMKLEFPSESVNVLFARTAIAVFASQLNITLEELEDIKVAVSEAVSNSVIHGYNEKQGNILIYAEYNDTTITITVEDYGCGIPDIQVAKTTGYTTIPQERMGLGLTFIYELMDNVKIDSQDGQGTKVVMSKNFSTETS